MIDKTKNLIQETSRTVEFNHLIILARLKNEKLDFWADPRMQRPFEYYEQEGNKGFYVIDPSDHGLEVLTKIDS